MEEEVLLARFNELIESGLVIYSEDQQTIVHIEDGVEYRFLLTSALTKKPRFQDTSSGTTIKAEKTTQTRPGSDIGTEGYEIGQVGEHHFLAANKFCVSKPHFLLMTSDGYRRQYEPLDQADFEAAWSLLSNVPSDYMMFYNCGEKGGCSRLHKHMQILPTPVKSLASFLDNEEGVEPAIPFKWFYCRFGSQRITPEWITSVYNELLQQAAEASAQYQVADEHETPGAAIAHNLILTRRWMMVVPRQKGTLRPGVGANALSMIGVLPVFTEEQIRDWSSQGVGKALSAVGMPV